MNEYILQRNMMDFKRISVIASIMSLIAPLFMLRAYLGYFDNASLLTEDTANTSILSGISFFISLSVIAFSFIIFLPSIAYGFMVPQKSNHMWNYDVIKSATGLSIVLNAIYSSLLFICIAYLSDIYKTDGLWTGSTVCFLFIFGVTLINFLVLRKPVNRVADYKSKKTKAKIKSLYFFAYPAGGMFMILLNCYGLLLLLNSVNHEKITDSFEDFVRVASVMIFLCITNIVPGIVFSLLNDRTSLIRAGYGALASAACALFLLASVLTSIVPLIINRTMTFTGIADWEVRSYIIDGSSFPEKRFSDEEWHTVASGIENKFIVQGIMVYSLNKTRLLCPQGIKPVYKNRLHFVPWNGSYDKDIALELERMSTACQPFAAGGVNRLSESRQKG